MTNAELSMVINATRQQVLRVELLASHLRRLEEQLTEELESRKATRKNIVQGVLIGAADLSNLRGDGQ